MKFSVGDKVLYPNRGAGTIVAKEDLELVDGFEGYFVIEVASRRLILRVPMSMMEELGIRRVMARRKLSRVLALLSDPPEPLPDDFKERQEQVREKLRSGQPAEIAETIRDLSCREQQSYLTKADTKLLAQGRDLLIDEAAIVLDKETVAVEQLLDKALSVHIAAGSDLG